MGFMSTLGKSRAAMVGAWIAAAASFGGAGAAYAQDQQPINVAVTTTDTSDVTLDTDCKAYKVGIVFADAECELAKRNIIEAKYFNQLIEIASAGSEPVCMKAIENDVVAGGRLTANLTEVPAKGQRCEALRTLVRNASPQAG